MFANLRRLTRKNIVLPATVTVQNRARGTTLTQAFPCHINNINKQGACIFLNKVMDGSFHIFHSTREDDNLSLLLKITVPPDDKHFSLSSIPVWFDLLQDRAENSKLVLNLLLLLESNR
ncbi:MAG: hypothetical protein GY860_20615 [Desulfobacteraceae bacterium]|nr:hypothetical protein [Desulfobacteraceae bacterium]